MSADEDLLDEDEADENENEQHLLGFVLAGKLDAILDKELINPPFSAGTTGTGGNQTHSSLSTRQNDKNGLSPLQLNYFYGD